MVVSVLIRSIILYLYLCNETLDEVKFEYERKNHLPFATILNAILFLSFDAQIHIRDTRRNYYSLDL